MKKTALLTILMSLGFCSLVLAHPASNVEVKADGNVLTVTALHGTGDINVHFIDSVKVTVNGQAAVLQQPVAQTSGTEQSLSYIIPGLKSGDAVNVMTHCNKGGDKSVDMMIP